ncbi:MAG: hypothetical protein U0Q18_27710 [Bryobacteraceae bacterium]
MANGKFSNGGVDTFQESKQFIGVRLQRGVPLLDRDWNEAEDIRRYYERSLRRNYFGNGVPDDTSFRIQPSPTPSAGDFLISPGRCLVDGYDLWNDSPRLYSSQAGSPTLPATAENTRFIVYLAPSITRVTAADDPDLSNNQDIKMETCVRDKVNWTVGVVRLPETIPAAAFPLAAINRPANAASITADMVEDLRNGPLNVRALVDDWAFLRNRVFALEQRVQVVEVGLQDARTKLAKLFWEVHLTATDENVFFGEKVSLSIRVVDGLGEPVVNCYLAMTSDWGHLDPPSATTDANGQATVELIGVESEVPPTRSEIGQLTKVATKLRRAALPNPGSVKYAEVFMEPEELNLVSRYTPQKALVDLAPHVPQFPIIDVPPSRTVHINISAKDAERGVVRGTGTIQVRIGMWIRPWLLSKISTLVGSLEVSARVGDLLRRGIGPNKAIDQNAVIGSLTDLYDQVHTDAFQAVKAQLFTNAAVPDETITQSGIIGQLVAQEVGSSVGQKVNTAIAARLNDLAGTGDVDPTSAKKASSAAVQRSSEISAGHSQKMRQTFNALRK